ncbi:hypothetical protein [Parapedobacter pyrenivorans]|uniref:hypothetical protein n=1 Tax=Parapedobacter pyrenivorans TaxID=1305674 RepID=UPI00333F3840
MKRIVSIFLLLTLIGSMFSRVFVLVGFELNKNYILGNLCENRDDQASSCVGKCYLTKKLNQAADNEKEHSKNSEHNNAETYLSHNQHAIANAALSLFPRLSKLGYGNTVDFVSNIPESIFRPPRIIDLMSKV